MRDWHWALRTLLRILLLIVPLVALAVLVFAGISFVSAQLKDVPSAPRVTLVAPPAEQPLNLSPASIETRVLGIYLRLRAPELSATVSSDSERRVFTVQPGETALSVSEQLAEEGLITDANLFRLYMRYNGIDQRLAAGDFELAPSMSMQEVAEILQQATRQEDITLVVPEGLRAEEVADLLNVKGVMDGNGFMALVRGGSASAEALGTYGFVPGGLSSLEGFLFPDTYRLPARATPADLLTRMLDDFDRRVTPDLRTEAEASGRSLYQVITMASIVEREAVRADERPLIASVYWNRLSGACSQETGGAFLQADPTVQYAAGRAGEWWWKPPSVDAYKTVDSPYNTYAHPGLPPGPIASPGLSAIEAAIRPADTHYCFFVATGDGGHVFAETLAEQEQNIQQYQK